jgi:hypothetical protein
MTTYVLSQHPSSWQVHRFAEDILEVASGVTTEDAAITLALDRAKLDRPSRILRIALNGDSRILFEFETEKKDEPSTPHGGISGGPIRFHVPGLF